MSASSPGWLKVTLHALCGVVLGAVFGYFIWASPMYDEPLSTGVYWIVGGALLVGLLAALFLDRFWDWLKEQIPWLWP